MSRPVSYSGPPQSALADVDEDLSNDEEAIETGHIFRTSTTGHASPGMNLLNGVMPTSSSIVGGGGGGGGNSTVGTPTTKKRRIRPASYGGTTNAATIGAILSADSHSVSDLSRFLQRAHSGTPQASTSALCSSTGSSPGSSPQVSRSHLPTGGGGGVAVRPRSALKDASVSSGHSNGHAFAGSPANLRKSGRSRTLEGALQYSARSVEALPVRPLSSLSGGVGGGVGQSGNAHALATATTTTTTMMGRGGLERPHTTYRSGMLNSFVEETSPLSATTMTMTTTTTAAGGIIHSKSLNQVPAITTAAAVATANMVISQGSATNLNIGLGVPVLVNTPSSRVSVPTNVKREPSSVSNNNSSSTNNNNHPSPGTPRDSQDHVLPSRSTSGSVTAMTSVGPHHHPPTTAPHTHHPPQQHDTPSVSQLPSHPPPPTSSNLSAAAAAAAVAAAIARSHSQIIRKDDGNDSPRPVTSLSASSSALPTSSDVTSLQPPSRDLSYNQWSTTLNARRLSGVGGHGAPSSSYRNRNAGIAEGAVGNEETGSFGGGGGGSNTPPPPMTSSMTGSWSAATTSASKFVKRRNSRRESSLNSSPNIRSHHHLHSMPVVPSSPHHQTLEEHSEGRSSQVAAQGGTVSHDGGGYDGTTSVGMRRQWSFFNVGAGGMGRKESSFGGSGVGDERRFEHGATQMMSVIPGSEGGSMSVRNLGGGGGASTHQQSQPPCPPPMGPSQPPALPFLSGIKKRTWSHSVTTPTVFSVGLSLQNTEMSTELKGIADLVTLTFLDTEVEDSFRSYFVRSYMPMWRLGLLIELIFGSMLFMYHMLVYPSESDEHMTLKSMRLKAFPDYSTWSTIECVPGFICERCARNKICNDFNPLYEALFFGISLVLPNLALYVLSYQFGPVTKLSRYTHTLSILHTLIICSIFVSWRHYVIEPSTSPYSSVAIYLFFVFASTLIFRVRFIHLVISSPLFLAIFIAESVTAFHTTPSTPPTSTIISVLTLLSGLFILCLGSYDHERSLRSHFIRSRMYMRTTAKLMDQLRELNRNYSDQIADFDSPLEKAIAMVKGIRTDPGVGRDHFESLGMVLALLNSSDLMTPDIERQVEGGRVALDEEGEAWLFTNLYRGRVRGNSKTNAARRRSGVGTGESGTVAVQNPVTDGLINPAQSLTTTTTNNHYGGGRQVSFSSQSTTELQSQKSLPVLGGVGRKKSGVDEESRPPISHRRESFAVSSNQMRKESIASIAVSAINQHYQYQQIKISVADTTDPTKTSLQEPPAQPPSTNPPSSLSTQSPSHLHGLPAILSEASLDVTTQHTNASPSPPTVPPVGAARGRNEGDATSSPLGSEEWDSITELNAHLQMVSLLEKVDHWNWDIFDLTLVSKHRPLFTLSHYLFLKSDLYSKFQIHPEVFLNFLTRVEGGYRREVPYHNSVHAADVLHGVAWLRDRCLELVEPTDLETLALYLAAIVHDFDHVSDPKAMLYNDRSVLENHHVASAFQILVSPECNFLAHLPKDDYKQIREIVIELVLATDLQTQHFLILSMFKNKVSLTKTFDPEAVLEDKTLLFKMMIKCADVSNPTKSWHLYEQWTARVLEEFFLQGDAEKLYGIPVSPYYDRDTIFVPASQLGFIDFICVPLFEAFDLFATVPCALEGLYSNRSYWIKTRDEAQKSGTTPGTHGPLTIPSNAPPVASNNSNASQIQAALIHPSSSQPRHAGSSAVDIDQMMSLGENLPCLAGGEEGGYSARAAADILVAKTSSMPALPVPWSVEGYGRGEAEKSKSGFFLRGSGDHG
ncbi:hypothetical protein HDU67_010370 [Dinochytrium kinnereticum]|nr:hypothetical protein HDU67_010370 [Dinochytrium kinnereticum]